MKDYSKKEFQRMNPKEVKEEVPFSLSSDGYKYAIVIDYAKYEVFTRIRDVVEGARQNPEKEDQANDKSGSE